ncbi:poly-beta-hydroxybutyrate polymerase N-terminal domain-containing protein [Cupriavidus necator]
MHSQWGERARNPGPLLDLVRRRWRQAHLSRISTRPAGSELFRAVDRVAAAMAANATGGISPTALWLAYSDWLVHLSRSPGKQAELVVKAWTKSGRLAEHAARRPLTDGEVLNCIEPLPGDTRFRAEAWQEPP